MAEMLAEMKKLNENIEGMRAELSHTLAIKRQHLNGKSQNYIAFEKWGSELLKGFDTQDIVRKFKVSKVCALNWMNQFVGYNDGYVLQRGIGNESQRVFKKMKK